MMKPSVQRVSLFATALWWGSLSVVGAGVVPLLFRHLDTPATAGRMAAHVFTLQTWLSVACAVVLLLVQVKTRARQPDTAAAHPPAALLGGLLLALLLEFVMTPHIVARDNLALWHAAGSGAYALQWLCATWLLWHSSPRGDASA